MSNDAPVNPTAKTLLTDFGKPIDRKEANTIIEKYTAIMETVQEQLGPAFKAARSKQSEKSNAEKLLLSGYNGYIFTKALVQRFFDNGDSEEKAEFLLVLVGAHPTDDGEFKEGEPTVLLVGCNRVEKDDKITFTSLDIPQPADEHPPHQFFPELPLREHGNAISFVLEK